ncbi:MAG TPA: metallophosphoesterase family protein [Vitreimonas sp.]|uniref:metallophosphoesterase family protein n=1 Tax=Vitreimonas sp. TaxID=3069702 RepID=UPI002D4FBAC8|nr:metallophosphoesterase family protein [Vitreimonas sp.]HYD86291.1 metallophosphoesterase family protein [Vitreimonas sp.]
MSDITYYAIGDVHGELAKLDALLRAIREDAVRRKVPHLIVFLGDLVDRGPDSRGVVERAMMLTLGGEAFTIKGNHEELMLHACDNRESVGIYWWAENGGDETILSYMMANGAKDDFRDAIDQAHLVWLRSLPVMVRDTPRRLVFVHGGIDPKTFPECSDEVRMWTRSHKFFDPGRWPERPELEGILVVHGHTPTHDFAPHVNPRRINVDTGACFGGPLTAVVLGPGEAPRFLRAA